jgi:hypothetical protein
MAGRKLLCLRSGLMLKNWGATFAVLVLFALGGDAAFLSASQHSPQTPQIQPQEKAEGGVIGPSNRDDKTAGPPQTPLEIIAEPHAEPPEEKFHNTNEQGGEQGTEFWPPLWGYRVKVTDSLLVAFTFLLFVATWLLWRATRNLVRGADQTAERQLRAYVLVTQVKVVDPDNDAPNAEISIKTQGGHLPIG